MADFVGDPTPGSTPAAPVQQVGSPAPDPVSAPPAAGASPLPGGQPAGAPAPVADPNLPATGNRELRDHFERQLAAIRAENVTLKAQSQKAEDFQARIAKALGAPTDPAEQTNAERAQIRKELVAVFPELAELETMKAASQQLYTQLGQDTMEKVFGQYTKSYGEPNDKAKAQIHRSFVAFLQSDPRFEDRYIRRDASLIKEFFEDLEGGLLQAPRIARGAAATTRSVPAAPRGGTSSSPVTGQAPKKFKDIDEMLDAAAGSLASQ